MNNQIYVIHPFKIEKTWVFTDPEKNLVKEPFVQSAGSIIESFVEGKESCEILFSSQEFPEANLCKRAEYGFGGTWYAIENKEFWLCPALLRYFETAPEQLWIKVQ